MVESDLATSPLAACSDHPCDHILEAYCPNCKHEVDAVCPECESSVESSGADERLSPAAASEFHRRLLHFIYSKRNSKFAVACFFIATGSAEADGLSMTVTANSFGVTKATVSKYCREICTYFNIQPSRYMRTETNAAKFRLSNRRPVKMIGNGGPALSVRTGSSI